MLSLRRAENDTSGVLDLMRAIAAQMVCVGHGISFFVSQIRSDHLPLMQNVGVLIFFALSGFLIAFTLLERSRDPHYGFMHFLVERTARIYSALLPCLVLIALIDLVVAVIVGPAAATALGFHGVKVFVANVLMLEGYHGISDKVTSLLQWPIFGSAAPLWTLAIEWHIYIFVGAAFFIFKRPMSALPLIPLAAAFSLMPLYYVFGAIQSDGVGQSLFVLWLGGASVFLIARSLRRPPRWLSIGVTIAAVLVFVLMTPPGKEYRPAGYPLLLLMLLGTVLASQASTLIARSPAALRVIQFAAGYSFTLYLIHHSVMMGVKMIWPDAGWAGFAGTVVASNILAAALASVTEVNHKQYATVLFGLLDRAVKAARLPQPFQPVRKTTD